MTLQRKSNRTVAMADPFFTDEDRQHLHAGVDDILSGALSMGPQVAAFEKEFAAMVGVRHAVAMNSCTSCLEVSLKALGVVPGDEVIVPSETFVATGMSVVLSGATPVFSEISPKDFCLDFEDVKSCVTSRTKGIILVHFAGQISDDIIEIKKYCVARGLFLIEDAAHSPGAVRYGTKAGAFGHAGCFSFYPTKVITAGEGGMLTTNDDKLAEFAVSMQHRGRDFSCQEEVYCREGRNVRMTEMAALTGRIQLGHLDEFLEARRRVVSIYKEMLAGNPQCVLVLPTDDRASAHWKIPLLMTEEFDRVQLTKIMRDKGISIDWTYNPPLHLQPVFRKILGMKEGCLPVTESLLKKHICLPCHPRMSVEDAQFVVQTLKEVFFHLP